MQISQGNMRAVPTFPSFGPTTQTLETPAASSWFNASNQIVGWTYDGRGNVQAVAGMNRSFVYDGENRQTTATINGVATTYSYDGDGHRVVKNSAGTITTFVNDAFGHLVAEYGGFNSDTATSYLTTDHLGSTRLVTGTGALVKKCYDYLPFGEEIPRGTLGRGTCYPAAPGADGVSSPPKKEMPRRD
jgi:YD repeat-containing protein